MPDIYVEIDYGKGNLKGKWVWEVPYVAPELFEALDKHHSIIPSFYTKKEGHIALYPTIYSKYKILKSIPSPFK